MEITLEELDSLDAHASEALDRGVGGTGKVDGFDASVLAELVASARRLIEVEDQLRVANQALAQAMPESAGQGVCFLAGKAYSIISGHRRLMADIKHSLGWVSPLQASEEK
jgi:hypothetical protein